MAVLGSHLTGLTLDVGCGRKPYERHCNSSAYFGLEIGGFAPYADVCYTGGVLPFRDCAFDSLISTQVLEHVPDDHQFVNEIYRVLRPGGLVLLSVPFVWDEHEQPTDYRRYSSFGIRRLLEQHGFEILQHRKTVQDARFIFQIINTYVFKACKARNARINLWATLVLTTMSNILGVLAGWILPSNADLYLDNVVLARRAWSAEATRE